MYNTNYATAIQQPVDLNRSLDSFRRPDRAAQFFIELENLFAVYSPSIQKLYTKYDSVFLQGGANGKVVVQPDFAEFHSIYSNVISSAVTPTSVIVFPGEAHNRRGVHIAGKDRAGKTVGSPLRMGISRILSGFYKEGPFVPVVLLKELHEIANKDHPCIRLHKLDVPKLNTLSSFDRKHLSDSLQKHFFHELARLKKKGLA